MVEFIPNVSSSSIENNVVQVGIVMDVDTCQVVPTMDFRAVRVEANIDTGDSQVDAVVDAEAAQVGEAVGTEDNLFGDTVGEIPAGERSIIHFTDVMIPSEDLFHSLQFMPIWVKIIGIPFSFLTIAVGRTLLAKLGEVMKIEYFDASAPEGSYLKGRVQMDLLDSFLGTTSVFRLNAEC
ncbi:hypothetical protein LINPERHAP1_LOCUS17472 [Linum perenne]